MRADWGAYGLPVHTPHLDALAATSLRFQHAYCQLSVCSPSRQSFMTSKRPDTNQVSRVGVWVFVSIYSIYTVCVGTRCTRIVSISIQRVCFDTVHTTLSAHSLHCTPHTYSLTLHPRHTVHHCTPGLELHRRQPAHHPGDARSLSRQRIPFPRPRQDLPRERRGMERGQVRTCIYVFHT